MWKIVAIAAGSIVCLTSVASALPIRYIYQGTVTGDVFNDHTGSFVESVTDLPFVWVIRSDTDDVDSVSGAPLIDSQLLFAPGMGELSLGGTAFVPEDEGVFAVFAPDELLIGAFDVDFIQGEGFYSNAPVPGLAGYMLASNVGPIGGLESDTFFSSEIQNARYEFPISFTGTTKFSFQSIVIPLPASMTLLASALGLGAALSGVGRRSRSKPDSTDDLAR